MNKQRLQKKFSSLDKELFLKFKETVGDSGDGTTRNLYLIFRFALLSTAVVFLLNLVLRFDVFPSSEWKLGEFGDFLGGVLNPILTFLMFVGLIITIVIQKTELSLARTEFKRTANALQEQSDSSKKQVIENTFFNLLSIHNETLNSLRFDSENLRCAINIEEAKTVGRAVFSSILTWMHNEEDTQKTHENYASFQDTENHVVGHYFRGLYQILKFIDECGLPDNDKNRYSRLLRAQLSTDELGVLYFNCISPNVDSGQFRTLLINYRMLEHIQLGKEDFRGNYTISSCVVYTVKENLMQYIEFSDDGSVIRSAFGTNPIAIKELYTRNK